MLKRQGPAIMASLVDLEMFFELLTRYRKRINNFMASHKVIASHELVFSVYLSYAFVR